MAFKAGSVVVDIVGKADALRRTFREAKDSVKDFGNQVKETDSQVKKIGQNIVSSMSEPKSMFGWLNKVGKTLKDIDYVAGRGFINTGKSAKQMVSEVEKASANLIQAQGRLSLASENYAVAALNAMSADLKGAKGKETSARKSQEAARAKVEEARSALASARAIDTNTQSTDRNSRSKEKQTGASRKAQMADLDLIFAAMYAQVALAGMISRLENIYTVGSRTRMALMGLESTVRGLGVSVDATKDTFKYFQQDGLMSDQEISSSMKNLLHMGYTIEDTKTIMDAFKDSAAFGRQASLGFGEAIVRTTEGMRLGLSTLSDGAGMAKNLGQILAENGYAAEDLSRATTDAGVRQALLNGIMKETSTSAGDAAKMAKDLTGTMSRLGAESNKLSTSILVALSGVLNSIAQTLIPVITAIKDWIDAHPRLSAAIIITIGIMLALVSACLIWQFIFPMLMKGFKELIGILTFMTSPMGLIIAAVIVLATVIAANWDIILSACKELYQGWTSYFGLMWNYIKSFASSVGDIFSSLGKIIMGAMTFDKSKVEDGISGLKQGLVDAATTFVDSSRATTDVISGTANVLFKKLDPVKLFSNTWDKVQGIFDPVNVDLSDKKANPRGSGVGGEKNKKATGPSPYQIAMRQYDHQVTMDELSEYDQKLKALALIGKTVQMTAEEQMDWEEKVYNLVKANNEDLKRYATEYMNYQVATGQKTVEQQSDFIEEQLKNEKDKYAKIQLMQQAYDLRQKLKQYDNDYFAYQVKIGKKTLQDKLDRINQEILAETDKFKKLALLNNKFDTETKLYNDQAYASVSKLMNEVYDGTNRSIDSVVNDIKKIEKYYRSLGAAGKEAADMASDAIKELQDNTDDWVDGVLDGLAKVTLGYEKFGNFIDNLFAEIAVSWVKYQLKQILGNVLGGLFNSMPWMSGKAHTGGYISRSSGIVQKYHTGGIIGGLESDERVLIGQTGERVLSRKETAAYEAGKRVAGNGGSGGGVTNIYNVQAMDAASFQDFAARHRNIFGAAAAQDLIEGGAMKKALASRRG
jgi:hypothetical protein